LRPPAGENRSAFSLAELLVVVSLLVLLLLALVMVRDALYVRAMGVRCQHRLDEIWGACARFARDHGDRLPRSWDPEQGRWYDVIGRRYLDEGRGFIGCPAAEAAGGRTSALPVLCVEMGGPPAGQRRSAGAGGWDRFAAWRGWVADPANIPCGADHTDGTETISPALLAGYSQVWFLMTDHRQDRVPLLDFPVYVHPGELDALRRFHREGGGIHILAESHVPDGDEYRYTRTANQLLRAIRCPIDVVPVGGSAEDGVLELAESDHPVLRGAGDSPAPVRRMKYRTTPGGLIVSGGAQGIGIQTREDKNRERCLIAAWEGGPGRVVVHGSYFAVDGTCFDWADGDVKAYLRNVDVWLRAGNRNGPHSYAYNRQLGGHPGPVSPDTICLMDYTGWEIDRDGEDPDGDDDDGCIALRHGGRANAVFADGRVEALRLEDIRSGMWTPQPED